MMAENKKTDDENNLKMAEYFVTCFIIFTYIKPFFITILLGEWLIFSEIARGRMKEKYGLHFNLITVLYLAR